MEWDLLDVTASAHPRDLFDDIPLGQVLSVEPRRALRRPREERARIDFAGIAGRKAQDGLRQRRNIWLTESVNSAVDSDGRGTGVR